MAKIVSANSNLGGRPKLHPYDEWFNLMESIKGQTDKEGKHKFVKLEKGKDFTCKARSLQEYIWVEAKNREVEVETCIQGENVLCRIKENPTNTTS